MYVIYQMKYIIKRKNYELGCTTQLIFKITKYKKNQHNTFTLYYSNN